VVLADLFDIALVALLVYWAFAFMRGAGAHLALAGIGMFGCVYLGAEQLGLGLTTWILQGFFAAFLILIVVLFQAELRHAFERIAVWSMRRTRTASSAPAVAEKLVGAITQLTSQKRGALIVIPGRDPLDRHLQGGIVLGGRLSEPLLLSIFDPHSAGHDGAIILDGEQVTRFAVHLPLSADHSQLRMRGTRHAAALGLAEQSDALVIVVSEERGRVSVAREGLLRELASPAALAGEVRNFLSDRFGSREQREPGWRRLRRDWKAVAGSIAASAALWLVVIPGSEQAERELAIPVVVTNLPDGYTLERVDPPQVSALVSGLRRDFFWLDPMAIRLEIDGFIAKLGRRTFPISSDLVTHPMGFSVQTVQPEKVRIYVKVGEPSDAAPSSSAGSDTGL